MPLNVRTHIELALNIIVAVAVLIVAAVVVHRYVSPGYSNAEILRQQAQQLVGTKLVIPDVSLAQNKKTLIFFLNKDCAYCKSSAPFYRYLLQQASRRNVTSVAIFPNSVESAKAFVKGADLPIENVQSGSLAAYKINATPTVLFIDDEGIVKRAWVGADPRQESQMRDELIALFDNNGQ